MDGEVELKVDGDSFGSHEKDECVYSQSPATDAVLRGPKDPRSKAKYNILSRL